MGSEEPIATRRSKTADPPNLRGTVLARPDARMKLDVKELDKFHTLGDKDRS